MTEVEALKDGVKDNGKTYSKGQTFDMAGRIVPAHEAAGQVKAVQTTPKNKQVTGSKNK